MSKKQVQIKDLQVHINALCAHLKEMGYSEYTIRRTNSVLNRYIRPVRKLVAKGIKI